VTDEQLGALREPGRWQAVFTPAEIVLLDLADRLIAHSDDLGPDLIARLREHYEDQQIAEILLVAGQANMNNRAGEAAKQLFQDR
jgi:alkylhydroperoxidase family enzyme